MRSIIKSKEIALTPWKNGLGVTSELAIRPAGADFKKNDFDWRLSSALVTGNNVFSHFPGYNRLLFVLSGHGLKLNNYTVGPSESHRFLGEDSIECVPVGGPVLDLGVIFNRSRFRCEMEVLQIDKAAELKLTRGTFFIKGLNTDLKVGDTPLPAIDILQIEAPDNCAVTADRYPAKILKISIRES